MFENISLLRSYVGKSDEDYKHFAPDGVLQTASMRSSDEEFLAVFYESGVSGKNISDDGGFKLLHRPPTGANEGG